LYSELSYSRGWNPLLFIISNHDEIAGLAPLMVKKKFGARIARFILQPYYSPDFLIEDHIRTDFIDYILDFLFQTLKCKIADLTFPTDSKNLHILEELCKSKRIYFDVEPCINSRVLPIECSWEQFKTLKGGSFRRRFKRMERKLNKTRSWRIACFEGEQNNSEVFNQILEVEKASWKETWRSQRKVSTDPELLITWKGAADVAATIPGFKHTTRFLELNDYPIAYSIVYQYKHKASIVKTSYNAYYRKYYPGMYIVHATIHALFNGQSVNNIDFLTDMPFMDAWTKTCQSRIRVFLGKGMLPTRTVSIYKNEYFRKILTMIINQPLPVTQN